MEDIKIKTSYIIVDCDCYGVKYEHTVTDLGHGKYEYSFFILEIWDADGVSIEYHRMSEQEQYK